MPIVRSQIIEDSAQRDGRRHVRERHVDSFGREHFVSYLAEAESVPSKGLAARATVLNAQLKAEEIAKAVEYAAKNGTLLGFRFTDATAAEAKAEISRIWPERNSAAMAATEESQKLNTARV